ncbi:hypothetical protein [Marinifilum caeruleilacunae]|uniref:DUF4367 domain-containing protein n=1 Tax=Marinifilum caeruleilacunae TaxID=2499076 RepID=A0ABX1X1M0_9BACT|nr:hypothetical protein [Marinifilum caeruleilacunae]NOU62291.1 hypothetical protein [Marinifilum caeruleilacunae]
MKYIIIAIAGIGILLFIGYLLLQMWFARVNTTERKQYLRRINELGLNGFTLKKEEQFAVLDGEIKSVEILNRYEIYEDIPIQFFFNIDKEDYVNHLEKHPPDNKWFDDLISYEIFEEKEDGYYNYSYVKGEKINTKFYVEFNELLEDIAEFRMKEN